MDDERLPLSRKLADVMEQFGITAQDLDDGELSVVDFRGKLADRRAALRPDQCPVFVKFTRGGGGGAAGPVLPKVLGALLLAAYLRKALRSPPIPAVTYSKALRHVHLGMAVGVFGGVACVQQAGRTEEPQEKKAWMRLHKGAGVLMLVSLLVRVVLRLRSAVPPRFPASVGFQRAESLSHRLAYLLLLALPGTGIAYSYYSGTAIPLCPMATKPHPTDRDLETAKTSLDTHRLLGRLLEYVWIPFHLGATGLHMANGHSVVKRISPFL